MNYLTLKLRFETLIVVKKTRGMGVFGFVKDEY